MPTAFALLRGTRALLLGSRAEEPIGAEGLLFRCLATVGSPARRPGAHRPASPLSKLEPQHQYPTCTTTVSLSWPRPWRCRDFPENSVDRSCRGRGPSRVQELVPLLFPLQALHPLLMHLLGHLFVSLLFLLGGPLVLDPLHSLLRKG